MKFSELPEAVQVVAANVLAAKIRQDDESEIVKPASNELAAGVRDAFCELYSEVKGAAYIVTVSVGDAPKLSPSEEDGRDRDRAIAVAITQTLVDSVRSLVSESQALGKWCEPEETFIKKSFATHNAINDSLGKIKCCDKAKGGLFKLLVAGDDLKCICTNCYRISAFHTPFILGTPFGDDLLRQG
ncbi:TPA: hypothetical protein ACOEAK_003198 [Enterobacter ludwigii]